MKEGDFVRIDYIGRIKESNEIFDLTEEILAKKEGLYNPNFNYGPVPVIIGSNFIVKGLEEALKKMKVGERKKIVVKPEDAFGERSPKLIKLAPISEFKKKDMDPYPGMPVTLNNLRGRVLSVSGGRVRVDFNHPLAGKDLEYEVEIKKEIINPKDKVKAVLECFLKIQEEDIDIVIENKVVNIEMKKKFDIPKELKERIARAIIKWVKDVEKVRFVEEYVTIN